MSSELNNPEEMEIPPLTPEDQMPEPDYPEPPMDQMPEPTEPSEEPEPTTPSSEEFERAKVLFESLDPEQQMQIVGKISETHGGVLNLLELMQPSEGSNEDPLAEEINLILMGVRQIRESQIFEIQEAKAHRKKIEKQPAQSSSNDEQIAELKSSLVNLHKKVNAIAKKIGL